MLRRKSQIKKRKRLQFLVGFCGFLLVVFLIIRLVKKSRTEKILNLSGGVMISTGDFSSSWGKAVEMNSGSVSGTTAASGSGNIQVVSTWALATNQNMERSQHFSIQLCNQIFDLYTCIIKNAPLENQPAMRESLKQTIQPWELMADTQLRETCEAVSKTDIFQQVKDHYTQKDMGYWCVF